MCVCVSKINFKIRESENLIENTFIEKISGKINFLEKNLERKNIFEKRNIF